MATAEETGNVVKAGSRVRIQVEEGGEHVIRLRSDDPNTWTAESIHVTTPLGRAVQGHRVGDTVEVEVHQILPVRKVEILAID